MSSIASVFLGACVGLLLACKSGEPPINRETARPAASAPAEPAMPQPQAAPAASNSASASDAKPTLAPGERKTFGEPLSETKVTELGRVIAEPDGYEEKTVLVEGLVRRACSRKGCWMELGIGEEGPSCRVTFKDYGFFVPLDSAGARARVQAVVHKKTLTPRDVQHHEREGAQFKNKNPDGSADETRLVAAGVELWR